MDWMRIRAKGKKNRTVATFVLTGARCSPRETVKERKEERKKERKAQKGAARGMERKSPEFDAQLAVYQ